MKRFIQISLLLLYLFGCRDEDFQPQEIVLSSDPLLSRVDSTYLYRNKAFTGRIIKSMNERENGFEIDVKDGRCHGQFLELYRDSTIRSNLHYIEGVLAGQQEGYHDNGQLSYHYKMTNGLLEGDYLEYYPNGNLQIHRVYKKNKIVKEKIYDIDKSIIANYVVKNGRTYGLIGSSSCISVINENDKSIKSKNGS